MPLDTYTKHAWGAGMFAGKMLRDGILDQLRAMFRDVDIVGPEPKAWEPEQELQCAVLLDAIDTIRSNSAALAHQREMDIKWLQDPHQDSPLSFTAICESLGMNPGAVRKRVMAEAGQVEPRMTRTKKTPCRCCGGMTFKGYCKGNNILD